MQQEYKIDKTRFFIIDTHGKNLEDDNHHDDYDYIRYSWDRTKNKKIRENDYFIYRRPGRNNEFKMFYFFGAGKFGSILNKDDETNIVSASLIECIIFQNIITADNKDLEKYEWHFKDKTKKNWSNFFVQYGITEIDESDYKFLLDLGTDGIHFTSTLDSQKNIIKDYESVYVDVEGKKQLVYSYKYERNSRLRAEALKIHGCSCYACGFNFYKKYGDIGKDFIEIHHIKPLSETSGEVLINPKFDLIPLCANCHRMIHRKKRPVTVEDLKKLINE